MSNSIIYIVFGILSIAILTGVVIIIRNAIIISSSYRFLKRKLKARNKTLVLPQIPFKSREAVQESQGLVKT